MMRVAKVGSMGRLLAREGDAVAAVARGDAHGTVGCGGEGVFGDGKDAAHAVSTGSTVCGGDGEGFFGRVGHDESRRAFGGVHHKDDHLGLLC